MDRAAGGYEVRRIPWERVPTIELMPALARRNPMHAFVEVDVTTARERLREHRQRTGETRSFTAFVITCLARAVDEQRSVQAFRRGRRLVVAEAVHVATLVEVEADGEAVPLPHVVRDAAHRTCAEIHHELRAAQGDGELVREVRRRMRPLRWAPRPLRWLLWRLIGRSPKRRIGYGGTVVVTSLGSVAAVRGWGVGVVSYPVTLTIGSIGRRPVVRDGQLEELETLCLTISLDHEVIDGAPAARFVRRLCDLLEQAYGLDDLEVGLPVVPVGGR
jgi:pyruvate/2-oxoglutarate dehydrogenase complex dihydrolipoamide acyltransferase (E2) component